MPAVPAAQEGDPGSSFESEASLFLKKTMSELLNYKYRLLKHGQIQETRKFSSHTVFHSTWESTRTNASPPPHPISITALPREEEGRKTEEAERMREGLRNWW